ncbi:DUF799 family lipoprotein [Pasteurellaceae bacterium LIM206]|nr:DUF799 family lipoprotein [Pasteurellaceae bacterium LIM206]
MKKLVLAAALAVLLTGCSTTPKTQYDYTALKTSDPKSILVVLPTNSSPDIKAPTSVLSRISQPLAEKGYYVYPVALVDEAFKQNGLTDGHAIQTASLKKINEIFDADSILYLDVSEYGTSYKLIDSETTVTVTGKLIDARTGKILWENTGTYAQSANAGQNNGLLGALVNAVVHQIVNTSKDYGYTVAQTTAINLVYLNNAPLLYGSRHPKYWKKQLTK